MKRENHSNRAVTHPTTPESPVSTTPGVKQSVNPNASLGAAALARHAGNEASLPRTVAFIDGANLYEGVLDLGWRLDYKRFRIYLAQNYGVSSALLFLGYVPHNCGLYRDLGNWGYSLAFKPTRRCSDGRVKGNCDADLVVHAVAGFYEGRFDEAVLVSGDGDFASLASFLASRGTLAAIIAPSYSRSSHLLMRTRVRRTFLDSLRDQLEYVRNSELEVNSPFGDDLGLIWPIADPGKPSPRESPTK